MDDRPVIRSSSLYAVVGGVQHPVEIKARDYVKVPGPHGLVEHSIDELDDLLSIRTQATWRGARIAVGTVMGNACGFFTYDRRLAEAERLPGDQYGGWTGSAPLSELTQVEEKVGSIHPRNRQG